MPLYTYKCKACDHVLDDVQQSIKDSPLVQCPRCEEPQLERVIGPTSFVLTGSGWAKDSYTKHDK